MRWKLHGAKGLEILWLWKAEGWSQGPCRTSYVSRFLGDLLPGTYAYPGRCVVEGQKLAQGKSWKTHRTPTTTYSVPTVATTPLCPGGGWGQCSKAVGPLNHSYPYPFPWQIERNERSCGAEGSCDKWLQSGSALVSQVRTEQPWPIGAPPAGCGDSAWLPSSHPASPEGRAWLTITQIITS